MSERRLAIFKIEGDGGHTVAINPDLVRYLKGVPTTNPGTVRIFFSHDDAVTVLGDIRSDAGLLGFEIPREAQRPVEINMNLD